MNLLKSWAFLLIAPLAGIASLAGLIVTHSAPPPAQQPAVSQDVLLTAPLSFRGPQIQQFLEQQASPLASYHELVGDQPLPASDLFWIASQSENYGISPKALLTTFYLEANTFAWPQNGGLMAHLQEIASRLAALEAESLSAPAADAKALPAPESNSATEALARYLAPQAKLTGPVRASVQSWADAYKKLFGESPQAKTADAGPTTVPFLRLPFNQPKDNFFKIESFFDHYTPGNFDEPTLSRFDGKVLPGAPFKTCWDGVTCYSGHNALDYNMPTGTPLYTAAAGQVILRYDYEGGLIIDHGNGYRTLYWHMDKIIVNLNQQLSEGQQIGYSGNRGPSTGPHLHFGLRLSALSRDIDPYGWWAATRDPWPYPSRWLWRGGLTADDGTAQSQLFYAQNWVRDGRGFGGDSYYTYSVASFGASTNWGVWGAYIPKAGNYNVFAYWPKDPENTNSAVYQVWNSKGVSSISLSQRLDGDRWVPLGTFAFDQGPAAVLLTDQTRDGTTHERVYFDAIKWVPAGGTYYFPAIPNSQPSTGMDLTP